LSAEDGVALLRHPNLPELGALATRVRKRLNPGRTVTYVIGRNINYTNVCWVQCGFCTFHRRAGDAESYVLPAEAIYQKVEELLALGGTEVLLQGGLNPALKIEWYEELLRGLKERYPIHLHALSPPEVLHLARVSRLSVREVLERLENEKAATARLDDLPLFAAAEPPPPPMKSMLDEAVAAIDPDELTPREALEALYRLKNLAKT